MFQTMTQIAKTYDIDAKTVGKLLYKLKIRDPQHPIEKGFPFEQAITHGIAKAYEARSGETYYRYNIVPVKEEFEKLLPVLSEQPKPKDDTAEKKATKPMSIEFKLQQMLTDLNRALETGEISQLYRLKADIADIYALLPSR